MSTKRAIFLGGLLTVPALLQLGACENYDTCKNTLSCEEYGSGGESSSGGNGDGDIGAGGMVGGHGGQGGAGSAACAACAGDTPACTEEHECVECTANDAEACTGTTELCDDAKNECVECLAHADCFDETKPLCDGGACVACDGNESCGELGNYCLDGGECVECTVETDDRDSTEDVCGTGVCNPQAQVCESGLDQKGKAACEACIADNECPTDYNCVPMEFKNVPRSGGYCLKDSTIDGCNQNPYRSLSPNRVSLSGAPSTKYCTVNEEFATCEAVIDLENDKGCSTAKDCGANGLDDGLCETVTASANKCTYECTGDDSECRTSGRASSCGGDADGPAGTYCGGM